MDGQQPAAWILERGIEELIGLADNSATALYSASVEEHETVRCLRAVQDIRFEHVRYLHCTVEHGMLIRRSSGSTLQAFTDVLWKGNPDTSLEAFSDADWAGDSDDRRSTGGFAIYLGFLRLQPAAATAR
ncbi:hypothetical protein Tco_1515056 [Tanacetum coccineum]